MFKKLKPGQILVASYATVNLIGTLLLLLPWASAEPGSTGIMEAWFTATSALTVTGLTVVTTSTHWSLFGKTVILVLMQIGGLGLMVLTTAVFVLLGLKIQLGQRVLVAQDRNHFSFAGILKLVRSIVLLTLMIEGIGALLMALLMPNILEQGLLEGGLFVVFHAVSAFNGAGFDLTGESLNPYRENLGLIMVFMVMILIGSLGYVVLQELIIQRRWRRMSLHSRLVLWVTGLITLFGSAFYYLSEYHHSLATLPMGQKLVESLFQAVTRTAGFTTVPVLGWSEPFIFLMIMMMFVGASPGSVGGGIKTTTLGTIVLAVVAIAQGKKNVIIFERELASESVSKAFTVTVIALLLATTCTLLLMVVEGLPLIPVLFEVISAMATVGLSMGITGELSAFGQAVIIVLMFVGRIGVLSLVLLLAAKEYRRIQYMKEEILIG
ncbi:TrkH family potassium uptake protein [Desulforamulus aquiferis]|uniref:Potassium transporter TrkG n=1 Tax=Desulforamulus aquiferis TaxID=1397668 RepID=A0AAW7ZJ70_9FIRM|nr:potassium transporter TrkG [Desulforamulus aquiferis]MDO7788999.1 potassium transporter TrkG [Desulforamulus aquiferis]